MQFPILIELRRSRRLLFSLLLLHALAAACVPAVPDPWFIRALLLLLIGVSLWRALQPSAIVALHIPAHGPMDCRLAGGDRVRASVSPDSTVFVQLVVLRLRIHGERRLRVLMLLNDSMSTDQFRLLRLWLRWYSESSLGAEKDV